MTNQFQPDLVDFGDMPGLGEWEDGHFRQHLQYNTALAPQGIVLPVYPIMNLVGIGNIELMDWLNLHATLHAILRGYAQIPGTDLSVLDPQSPDSWNNWQQYHRFEHYAFDQRFGLGVI